jgi:hypothetical protein
MRDQGSLTHDPLDARQFEIAVRRLADSGGQDNTISIGRLLADIAKNAHLLTRQRFVKGYEDETEQREWAREMSVEQADRDWRRFGGDGDAFDATKVAPDLEQLKVTVNSVAAFADRQVAHIDRRGVKQSPTFAELDKAIEVLGEVLGMYSVLIKGSRMAFYEPTIQDDWKSPFRRPIFESFPPRRQIPGSVG